VRDTISQILRHYSKPTLSLQGYVPSAVLVPLFLKQGQYHLLYTQRSHEVRDHKGQISFPGGCREAEDRDLLQTALRETQEELGIKPQDVEILGELGDIYTPTHYQITPFVGMIPHPYAITPNRHEIEALIEVPFDHLLEPNNEHHGHLEFFDTDMDMPYFRYQQHTIWGATGRITRELVELIKKNL
jgi:8-oxo-dGTP pyrophosphatase MutT (NUDIX family)